MTNDTKCTFWCAALVFVHKISISGDEYKWDDASEAVLWSLVEKYKKELYDQKNRFTRNEYLDKIARELCMFRFEYLCLKKLWNLNRNDCFSHICNNCLFQTLS